MSKPKTRTYDWKAEVDKVEPRRYEPTVEYRFSNDRKFKRKAKDSGVYN